MTHLSNIIKRIKENTEYYITYKNQGKSERTPIMPNMYENAKHNVELLKLQGATSVRVHEVKQ